MFKNKKVSQQFRSKGFCLFPLLNAAQVDTLRNVYNVYAVTHSQANEKFKGTGWIQNTAQRIEISNELNLYLAPALQQHLQHYKIIGSGFLEKETGADSEVIPHQDWTYVDEPEFNSMNIWVALEDVTAQNGAMFVVPYSHKICSGYLRPAPDYPVPFKNIIPLLQQLKTVIELKAGECLCFNNRIVHGSLPNQSTSKRLAVVTTVLPQHAALHHHYIHNPLQPTEITEYSLTNEQFLAIERGQAPVQYIGKSTTSTFYPTITATYFKRRSLFLNFIDKPYAW